MRFLLIITVLFFFISCQKEKTKTDSPVVEVEKKSSESDSQVFIEESDWSSFFNNITEEGFQKEDHKFYFDNPFMQRAFLNAAENSGFARRISVSINGKMDENLYKPIGGLSILVKEDKYYAFSQSTINKIDGLPIRMLVDVTTFETTTKRVGFLEATDKPNAYNKYNEEQNVHGVFDWDSPMIAPDTFIPVEKVIIVDPQTFEISIFDNEDESYKVFIDIAFLE